MLDLGNIKSSVQSHQVLLIHLTAILYYFVLWGGSVISCIFVIFPTLYKSDPSFYWNLFLLFYFPVNMMGNYALGVKNPSIYRNGVLLDEVPRSWKLCMECQQHCPPCTHHCTLCNACVLKRDHHCFFFATCIGLKNLKYFIPFALHICLGSLYIMSQTFVYLNSTYKEISLFSWTTIFSYTFPGLFYNYWTGTLTTLNFICITCFYGSISTFLGAGFLFVGNMVFLLLGQTSYENQKGIRTFSCGVKKNFELVFGKWGILSFFIPIPFETREINSPWGIPKFVKGV